MPVGAVREPPAPTDVATQTSEPAPAEAGVVDLCRTRSIDMKPFRVQTPSTLLDATTLLRDRDRAATVLAGGTDILGEVKEGTRSPETLVHLGGIDALWGIESGPDGTSIGSMVTLAEIERSDDIRRLYPTLAEAAASVATPQIRNAGTLGGNLCQRPRCWYYRSPLFDCLKKGGDTCFAVDGLNKYHAIVGGSSCHIVHPSDTAVALLALGAEVELSNGTTTRSLGTQQFFRGPDRDILRENALREDEILTRVKLPHPKPGAKSIYLKAKERAAYDFALVSVAALVEVSDDVITGASIALGGVAPVPYLAVAASNSLYGRRAVAVDFKSIGALAVKEAVPMRDNAYKVRLASNLVAHAIESLLTA